MRLIVLALIAVCAAIAFGGFIYAVATKTTNNCQATLTFAQAMEAAVKADPETTPAGQARADAFFTDVYSKLDC